MPCPTLLAENNSGSFDLTEPRVETATGFSHLLTDSYTLYLMTHNFHWNVTGPMFGSLHLMFMNQYVEQWNALDMIAERMRALGYPAPATYRRFSELALSTRSRAFRQHS